MNLSGGATCPLYVAVGLVDLPCNCSSDIPADIDDGPYPLLVFIHGTGGFRYNSLMNMVHLASRGFVVIAADHPGAWEQEAMFRPVSF